MSQESELALLARRSEGLWPDVREVNFFSHFVFSFGEHLWRNSINFWPETALFLWSCLPFGAFVGAFVAPVRCFAYRPCVPALLYLACVFHQSLLPCVHQSRRLQSLLPSCPCSLCCPKSHTVSPRLGPRRVCP